jgi:N6-adenosine-specific RNA methylase IME4
LLPLLIAGFYSSDHYYQWVDSREIENQYPTMTVQEICALNVPSENNAVLYLWATAPKLREALKVMEAWGFEYKTSF